MTLIPTEESKKTLALLKENIRLQEQNAELVEMLLKCQVLCETLKVNGVAKEIKNLLTKYKKP